MKLFLLSFCVCANLFVGYSQDFPLDINNDIENVISDKFISFEINPDVLLQKNCSTTRNEWICMAKSLSPSYIRIEEFPELDLMANNRKLEKEKSESANPFKQIEEIKTLNNFINWTKNANTVPVIKLNNSERLESGKWNSMSAIKIFSMAHRLELNKCVWQFDIDCEKQNLSTYIDDLKSLKIIVDSFLFGRDLDWKIITGDLSNCINENSFENWSEFVKKSESIVDAIDYDYVSDLSLLNVNLSDVKRNMLSRNIQLWKKYNAVSNTEEENYFEWLKTLGNSAVEGFSVVVKKLTEEDIVQPSLSYYVSLLHKKFVGPEVLKVKIDDENMGNLSMFAHCAILPSGRVQDGITLFAINENDEERNITSKFSTKENGGSIMQFILQKYDREIFLNGEKMASEGDLKPMMIELPSGEPIHINIPPRSIGFWIITNTNVRACSNQIGKTILFRNMQHKQLHPDHMTEVLKELLSNQDMKTSFKSKRSVEIEKEKSGEETTTELESPISETDDELFEKLSKLTARSWRFENYEDLFDTVARLRLMMHLEKQLIEMGNLFLQSNETLTDIAESEKETVSNDSDKVQVRIVRNVDQNDMQNLNMPPTTIKSYGEEITDHLSEKNTATEDESNKKNDESMSAKIVMPKTQKVQLEKSVENLEELIVKMKKLLKKLDDKVENAGSEENFESMDEKEPLLKLPGGADPELQLKTELLKNKIKLNELRNKIKARIAKLKTKLKLATSHKILKRNAKDNEIGSNELFTEEINNDVEKLETFEKINSQGFLDFKDNHSKINEHFDMEKNKSFGNNSEEEIDKTNFRLGKPIDNRNPIFRETNSTTTDALEIDVTEKNIEEIDSTKKVHNFLMGLSDIYDSLATKLDKLLKDIFE